MKAEKDFVELMITGQRAVGLDEISSRLIGILFIEPEPISLDELAKKTGYSTAAISTGIKFLEATGTVTRTKQPNDRKVYFFMEKDLFKQFYVHFKKAYECKLVYYLDNLPGIIKQMKTEKKTKEDTKKLKISEDYYNQLKKMESLFKNMMEGLLELENNN